MNTVAFLPTTRAEMSERGWDELDILLISGDAYVDHPSYGVSVVGRLLESRGFRVGVIAQPDWHGTADFTTLGRPRLFAGISAGNVDSMIANYSANKRPRDSDDYSPARQARRRPDRAVIVYANRVREAFGAQVPIVIGGIEASLRRFAHYDYWDDRVRRSILLDSRADLLVYGMGERQVIEIARRLAAGEPIGSLVDIRGTAVVRGAREAAGSGRPVRLLPSLEEVQADPDRFNEAFNLIRAQMDPAREEVLLQPHGDRVVAVNPPALPLGEAELDEVYALPYARAWHPRYDATGGVPALETVRHSVTAHRGCCGECSFCAIHFHQGRIVQSRSPASILAEIAALAGRPDFRGTITDIGGPTANLYAATCGKWQRNTFCSERSCLVPQPCPGLKLGYGTCLDLYRRAAAVPGVKHVFLGSGLRHDLLVQPQARPYLEQICRHQISGILKVAPEHSSDRLLGLMNKPPFRVYERFTALFREAAAAAGKRIFIVNYFITSHPGESLEETYALARYLAERHIRPEQIQDFIPSPMTRSTAMYYTGRDPLGGQPVQVPRALRERKKHRALVQYDQPRNRPLLMEALRELGRLEQLSLFVQSAPRGPRGSRPEHSAPPERPQRATRPARPAGQAPGGAAGQNARRTRQAKRRP